MKRIQASLYAVDWGLFAALCMAIPLIVPFLQAGLPVAEDAENHLHRIVSVLVNWQNGYLWPRWTPYMYLQYGYPLHNFHPAGTYLIQALIYTLTRLDIISVYKVSVIGITFLYPIGAYLFARTFTGRSGALVAAAAYIYAPFRFRELWVQQDIPQFAAMLMLPWLLWAMARGAERRRIGWGVLIAIFLGALILFHHSTTFLAVPLIVGYALFLIVERWHIDDFRVATRTALTIIGGLALGTLLTTIYWLPALTELQYLQDRLNRDAAFQVINNFVPLSQLVSRTIPIDRSWLNWPTIISPEGARVGTMQLAMLGIGSLVWLPHFRIPIRVRWHVLLGTAGAVFCIFMITSSSVVIWKVIPFGSEIQFPWRLLGDVLVLVIPAAAAIPSLFADRWRPWAAAAIIFAFFWSVLPMLYAPLSFTQIPPPTPATENVHEINTGNLGTTTVNEYLPKWAQQSTLASLSSSDLRNQAANALQTFGWQVWPDDNNLPGGATITTLTPTSPGSSLYRIQTPSAYTLEFHQLYFPGWNVQIDGQPAALTPSEPAGLITTPLTAGTHIVSIRYGGTTVQHIADSVSLISVLSALGLLIFALVKECQHRSRARWMDTMAADSDSLPPTPSGTSDFRERRLAQGVILASLAFVIVNQTIIVPHTDLFRSASAPGITPASVHTRTSFGNSLVLLGYDISKSTLSPGSLFHVRLYWQAVQKINTKLQVSVSLTSLDGQQLWGQTTSYGLDPASWPLQTVYVTDDHDVSLATNTPPFDVALRASVFIQESSPLQFLKTSTGATDAILTTLPVIGNYKVATDNQIKPISVTFDGTDELVGYRFSAGTSPGQTCLTLRWQAQSAAFNLPQIQVMIHFLGSKNTFLGAADSPPLNGQDPVSDWQPGQILDDTHCFTPPTGLQKIAVGLYSLPEVQRLPVTSSGGITVKDASVTIPFS